MVTAEQAARWIAVLWFLLCAVGGFFIAWRLCAGVTDRLVRHATPRRQRVAMGGLIAIGTLAVALVLRSLL